MRVILAALLCALAGPVPAANGPERLHAFLDQMQSLRAEFRQSVYDEDSRQLDASSGTVYIERPGRFRWDYAGPYAQEIVGDGERVWIYDSDLEQVTVRDLGEALGDTPVMLLSSNEPVEHSFAVRALDGPDGYAWVGLRPLGDQVSFTEIRLGFDGETLRVMELQDAFGQLTRLQFAAVERNLHLDPELFRFTPPPGADVFSN